MVIGGGIEKHPVHELQHTTAALSTTAVMAFCLLKFPFPSLTTQDPVAALNASMFANELPFINL
jgi:hypothetical protein